MSNRLSIFFGLFVLFALCAPAGLHSMKEQKDIITLITSDEQNILVPQHIINEFQTIANLIEDTGSDEPISVPNVDSKTLKTMTQLAQQLQELKQVDSALLVSEKIFMPRAYQIKIKPILEELSNEQLVDVIMAANFLDNEMIINAIAAVIANHLSVETTKEKSNFMNLPQELQDRIAWYVTLRKDGIMQECSIADYINKYNVLNYMDCIDFLHNKLTSLFGLQRIRGLRALQSLGLDHNNLSSIPAGAFKGLVALQQLDLGYNNQLSSIHPDAFKGLVSLQMLWLNHNKLSDEQKERIKADIKKVAPNAKIYF